MIFVDLEKIFSNHIKNVVKQNPNKYSDLEKIEKDLYKIYTNWCKNTSEEIDNLTPIEYVNALVDDSEIYDYIEYLIDNKIDISDIVTDKIIDLPDTADFMFKILTTKPKVVSGYVIDVLNEIGGKKVTKFYVDQLAKNKSMDKDTENAMYEFLSFDNADAVDMILEKMYNVDVDTQKFFAEILVNYKNNDNIYMWLLSMFYRGDDIPLFAELLGKYGNPKAIDILKSMAVEKDINYLEFMELRNAVERLGGDWLLEKDFSEDEYFKKIVKKEDEN